MKSIAMVVVRNPWFWTIVVVVLVAYWFFFYLEWVTVPSGRNLTADAAADPYYGAKKFLNELNVQSSSDMASAEPFYRVLTPWNSVVLMSGPSTELRPENREELENWINQGGRIIYVAQSNSATTQRLLNQYGLTMQVTSKRPKVDDSIDECATAGQLEIWRFDVSNSTFHVLAHRYWRVRQKGSLVLGSPTHIVPMQSGAFIFTTSMRPWRNRQISCHDNALFLYSLVKGPHRPLADSVNLYWLNPKNDQTLLAMIWDKYKFALLLILAVVFLWIWNRNLRESPVATNPAEKSVASSITNLLLSIGLFKYQNAGSEELLRSLRREVLAKHEGVSGLDLAKRFEQISLYSISEIQDALYGSSLKADRNFVKKVELLQRLRSVGRDE